ncbi:uncharacterized protein EHS24_003878 [Apiotrichum porosum]|uniref:Uncharacterized protein n=1 Tax=Apiotrichum porosum TaxID=105984 RepID=A0A427XDE8_9TREE|nr:uncharacterized protein EHS24_003878 [Apiotrichum porosum]RSH76941.1 hypothetical protein EHS24_003878 [Apiotrichum porosum]
MVYVLGLFVVFLVILVMWLYRYLRARWNAQKQARNASPDDPTLPIFHRPSFASTADLVAEHIVLPQPVQVNPYGYGMYSRLGGDYGRGAGNPLPAVNRAHPECGSDPDLPAYSKFATSPCRHKGGGRCFVFARPSVGSSDPHIVSVRLMRASEPFLPQTRHRVLDVPPAVF